MAISVADNFSYQGSKPLDSRIKYDTLSAMKSVPDASVYDGCMAFCIETDKYYTWLSTNDVDSTLGKWREYASGGGAELGHFLPLKSNLITDYIAFIAGVTGLTLTKDSSIADTSVAGDASTAVMIYYTNSSRVDISKIEILYIGTDETKSLNVAFDGTNARVSYSWAGTLFMARANISNGAGTFSFVSAVSTLYDFTNVQPWVGKTTTITGSTAFVDRCCNHFYNEDSTEFLEGKENCLYVDVTTKGIFYFDGLEFVPTSAQAYTAGYGLNLENNEFSADNMTTEDMDDVVTPLPGPSSAAQRPFMYSLEEHLIGQWVDGTPLYQCTYTGKMPTTINTSKNIVSTVGKTIRYMEGYAVWYDSSSSYGIVPLNWVESGNASDKCEMAVDYGAKYVSIYVSSAAFLGRDYFVTLRYTK